MKTGEIQVLSISRATEHGLYLKDDEGNEALLPRNEVTPGLAPGMPAEVFIYRDSEDRLTATFHSPGVTVGGTAVLQVSDITSIGAFLSWGLQKDLFLPFSEMTTRPQKDDRVLIALYRDKSDRLCASMKKASYSLKTQSDHVPGEEVTGFVYEINPELGAFVAIDGIYSALIPAGELSAVGDDILFTYITARISRVRDDGRIDLSLRKRVDRQMDDDSGMLLELIRDNGGTLPVGDKSDPELIMEKTGLSKAAFKRAVGRLYREHLVVPGRDSVVLQDGGKM